MKKEYLYALVSVLCWGTISSISKGLLSGVDTMFTLFVSLGFATVFLLVFLWKKGKLKDMAELWKDDGGKLMILAMTGIGSLGVLFYNLFLLSGTKRLPAQQAFVINYLWPALIIVLSSIILKERFTIPKFIAVLFSFGGVMVVTTNGSMEAFRNTSVIGIIFCVLAAFSYAFYSTLGKFAEKQAKEKDKIYDSDIAVFIAHASGFVAAGVYVAVAAATGHMETPLITAPILAGMAAYGIVCNAFPYLTWAMALSRGNTAVVANLAYLTPVISLFLTHFFLGEKITIFSVLGLAMILLGILIQSIAANRKAK